MLSVKSWLSARLLTQQGTDFRGMDGVSSAAFSSSSPQICSARTNFWVGGTLQHQNHYPAIPIGSESLHPGIQELLKLVSGRQPVNTTFEHLEAINAGFFSNPSKSNSWDVFQALDNSGDEQLPWRWLLPGPSSPFSLCCSGKIRGFYPSANNDKTVSHPKLLSNSSFPKMKKLLLTQILPSLYLFTAHLPWCTSQCCLHIPQPFKAEMLLHLS